jgi:ATP-dependent Clp protease ATP-binding subunit ClpA
MFERFTPKARAAVVGAQQEARALGHGRISSTHLLLALLDSEGVAAAVLHRIGVQRAALSADLTTLGGSDAQALEHLGIDLDAVRREAEATFGPGALDRPARRSARGLRSRVLGEHLPFAADAKAALEQSLREAQALGHRYLGTEHLLLALVANRHGPVAASLRRVGVAGDYETIRSRVLDELAGAERP